MDDEDVAPGIERDARRAAEVHAGREVGGFGDGDVGERWGWHGGREEEGQRVLHWHIIALPSRYFHMFVFQHRQQNPYCGSGSRMIS
jgi:hypothetical protein